MDELIAFLNERLAEDERLAIAARDEPETGWWWSEDAESAPERHIARHDPARVLADVAAKRAIVAACAYNLEYEEYGHTLAERVLRALALPYADHEDYKPHWRPRDV